MSQNHLATAYKAPDWNRTIGGRKYSLNKEIEAAEESHARKGAVGFAACSRPFGACATDRRIFSFVTMSPSFSNCQLFHGITHSTGIFTSHRDSLLAARFSRVAIGTASSRDGNRLFYEDSTTSVRGLSLYTRDVFCIRCIIIVASIMCHVLHKAHLFNLASILKSIFKNLRSMEL